MLTGYYIKTEMAGTGHVYVVRISIEERVERCYMSTNHPGTLEAVGKVTYLLPCSGEEIALKNSGVLPVEPVILPEVQRASRGPRLFLIPHKELVAAGPSVVESC